VSRRAEKKNAGLTAAVGLSRVDMMVSFLVKQRQTRTSLWPTTSSSMAGFFGIPNYLPRTADTLFFVKQMNANVLCKMFFYDKIIMNISIVASRANNIILA
jgi:hypothetical protein